MEFYYTSLHTPNIDVQYKTFSSTYGFLQSHCISIANDYEHQKNILDLLLVGKTFSNKIWSALHQF